MNFIWILYLLYGIGVKAEERILEMKEITLMDNQDNPKYISNRTGRKFFKKLHNGAAFLAGIKLGSYLTKNGHLIPTIGHGSLATANSFQVFGKTISSALSLSYGDGPLAVPLHDPVELDVENSTSENSSTRTPIQHVLVTVLDNPTDYTLEKLKAIAKVSENTGLQNQSNSTTTDINQKIHLNELIDSHNRRVYDLNKHINYSRINSKF